MLLVATTAFLREQVMDWDGALGYGHPGLMNEAVNFAPRRGHGVAKWLPWLTCAVLEPMVGMQKAFGTVDLNALIRLPLTRAGESVQSTGVWVCDVVVVSGDV
jgi:hypothetical protein